MNDLHELNEQVAEKLMGLKWHEYGVLPKYANTWEGAGMVVERICELGMFPDIDRCGQPGSVATWRAAIDWKIDGEWERVNAYADTFPEAICRAALAAVECEK